MPRLVQLASAMTLILHAATALAAGTVDTRAGAAGVTGDTGASSTATASDTVMTAKKPWSASATLGTSYVGGLINPGTDLTNPPAGSDIVGFGPTYNPGLDFTLGMGVSYRFTDKFSGSASYRISKGFAFDDNGEYEPGNFGSTSSQLVDTGDLGLKFSDNALAKWEAANITVTGSVSGTVPASRASLFCNPMYGALGAGLGASRPFEVGVSISVSTGFSKPFYAYSAPPRGGVGGACTTPLANYDGTTTLTSTETPTSDRAARVAMARLNSNWAWSNTLGVSNWHALLALAAPKLRDGWFWKKFSTSFSMGLTTRKALRDPDYTVQTLSGPVVVETSHAPLTVKYSFSVGASYSINDHLGLGLSFSNDVPQLLYDPATYYATWLPSTTISVSLSGSY